MSDSNNYLFPATVIIDCREKLPFSFEGIKADKRDGGGFIIVNSTRAQIRTGDYTIEGFADQICIERKSKLDLWGTISQRRARFERELMRLQEIPVAAIVIETDWLDVLVPPPRAKLPPKILYRTILAWKQRYPNVHWDFMGHRRFAEVHTFRMMERFFREKMALDTPRRKKKC